MAKEAIPHLSINGWITSPVNIMTKLFEYFLTSDYSQTLIYRGHIASLKYILATYANISDIRDNIKSALTKMYERYFDRVEVITYDNAEEISGQYNIYIDLSLTKDDKVYTLKQNIHTHGQNIINMDELITELNRTIQ